MTDEKTLVIFDFRSSISDGIDDFNLILPTASIPRKGESVGFDKEELSVTNDHAKDILTNGAFFEIDDVTWNYSKAGVNHVRIFLKEL